MECDAKAANNFAATVAAGRRFAFVGLSDGRLGIAIEGEHGYYQLSYDPFPTYEAAQKETDRINKLTSLSPEDANIMVLRSMRAMREPHFKPELTGKQMDLIRGLVDLESICDERAEGWTDEEFEQLGELLENTKPEP